MKKENPFSVYSPEEISSAEFKEIFVKEFTWINALETQKDFFYLWNERFRKKHVIKLFRNCASNMLL